MGRNRRLTVSELKRAAGPDVERLLQETTEAFCKTLTSRPKGSGMRWDKPNAAAIMTLAALEHSHLWHAC